MIEENDPYVKFMLNMGLVEKIGPDKWILTESGKEAFRQMVIADPDYARKNFPDWVHLVH